MVCLIPNSHEFNYLCHKYQLFFLCKGLSPVKISAGWSCVVGSLRFAQLFFSRSVIFC